MIVCDLHIVGTILSPFKTQSPLLVDPDTEQALPVSRQCFQAIAWKPYQIFKAGCAIKDLKPSLGLGAEPLEPSNSPPFKKGLSVFVAKASNHGRTLTPVTCYVKRSVNFLIIWTRREIATFVGHEVIGGDKAE